jgi:hypothetical protein
MLCLERRAKRVCEIQAVEINFSYVSRYALDRTKLKRKVNVRSEMGIAQLDEQRAGEKRQIHLNAVENNI